MSWKSIKTVETSFFQPKNHRFCSHRFWEFLNSKSELVKKQYLILKFKNRINDYLRNVLKIKDFETPKNRRFFECPRTCKKSLIFYGCKSEICKHCQKSIDFWRNESKHAKISDFCCLENHRFSKDSPVSCSGPY